MGHHCIRCTPIVLVRMDHEAGNRARESCSGSACKSSCPCSSPSAQSTCRMPCRARIYPSTSNRKSPCTNAMSMISMLPTTLEMPLLLEITTSLAEVAFPLELPPRIPRWSRPQTAIYLHALLLGGWRTLYRRSCRNALRTQTDVNGMLLLLPKQKAVVPRRNNIVLVGSGMTAP
jgi:hypothetical protein